jgi:hypothetical protein
MQMLSQPKGPLSILQLWLLALIFPTPTVKKDHLLFQFIIPLHRYPTHVVVICITKVLESLIYLEMNVVVDE